MLAEGSNGSVEFVEERIVIRRKGLANVLTQGFQGDKTIPLSSVTAVQFRPAGRVMAGLIQFTILGGREFRGGMLEATKDENAVLFTAEHQPDFERLRDAVQSRLGSSGVPHPRKSNVSDIVALANLLERGHITASEFEAEKAKLFSAKHFEEFPKHNEAVVTSDSLSSERQTAETLAYGDGFGKGWFWIVLLVVATITISSLLS